MNTASIASRRIAIAFPTGVAHLERTLHGVQRYATERGHWSLVISPEAHFLPVSSLAGWDGDGVIAMINTEDDACVAKSLGVPVVNISGAMEDAGLPRVRVDYRTAGQMAAEHLLDSGFRRFAYYGLRDFWYAEQYGAGFSQRVAQYGAECALHESPPSIGAAKPWQQGQAELEKWLTSLTTPVGMAASHDNRARMVIDACQRLNLRVPDDVAVIGLNNDTLSCEYCNPPLSSVARNGEEVGYRAAKLLEEMIEGAPPPSRDILIEPVGVVKRASTDVLAIEDPQLSRAVHFIQDNVGKPFGVQEVISHTNVSRRWLEYAFQKWLRRTPHGFICETRVAHAQKLLASSDELSYSDVARACGFSSNKRLNVVFRRVTGISPREFRESHLKATTESN